LHSLWHAAPCRNELFLPVAEASSRSFAHLLRHGPRRRPTSGKPSNQPDEPTMLLTCIRKRSTDGLRCEGTWACACGRSKDRLGIPGMECDIHSCIGNSTPNRKFVSGSRVNSARNRPLLERHRTGSSRKQTSLWLAGHPKTPGSTSSLGHFRPIQQTSPTGPLPLRSESGRQVLMRNWSRGQIADIAHCHSGASRKTTHIAAG
jgi:hypothetical protein